MRLRLYDHPLSGNAYKVRWLLHALALPYETVAVDFHPGREHRSERFRATVNPRGEIPVLEHDGQMLADSGAILRHLATHHDPSRHWLPEDAAVRARIDAALALADELSRTVAAARLHLSFGLPADLAACQRAGRAVLRVLDDRLAARAVLGAPWLADARPTIADIACFPYAALCREAGLDPLEWPALRAWIDALRHHACFIPMPGILAPQA